MKRVGHGKISLTRNIGHGFPVIELEVDVFQTEDNELKFFYAPDKRNAAHLTIEFHKEVEG